MVDHPAVKALPEVPPKFQLEQAPNGMWEYWQDPWLFGIGVTKNGIMPVHATTKEQAEAYVNNLYPEAFPIEAPTTAKKI